MLFEVESFQLSLDAITFEAALQEKSFKTDIIAALPPDVRRGYASPLAFPEVGAVTLVRALPQVFFGPKAEPGAQPQPQ